MLHGNDGGFRDFRRRERSGLDFLGSQSMAGNVDNVVDPAQDAVISVSGLHRGITGKVWPVAPVLAVLGLCSTAAK